MKKLSSWRTFFGGVPRLGTVLAVSYISFTSTEHQIFTLQNGTGFKYKCNGLRIETFQGRPFPNQEGCEGERLILPSTREKLNQFVTAVNYSGPFIYLGNFRYFFSKVYIEGNGLCISVHYKPTDSHIYLLYSSSHPSHVKNSIPYSQFLRLRRLCDRSDFSLKSEEMCVFFDKRGYPASVVQASHHRVRQIDRQSALQTAQKENNDRIFHLPHISPSQPRSKIHHSKKL